jgi:hypothetical protein
MSEETKFLCVCCEKREHDCLPDNDLRGLVCRECYPWLSWAQRALGRAGLCYPTEHTPEQVTT